MKAAVLASILGVAAADLAITWSDCGGKHGSTSGGYPSILPLGSKTAMVSIGHTDDEITGGTFDIELKAGGGLIDSNFTGNNCEAKSFNLPLGLGKLDWDGIACPDSRHRGFLFHVTMASSLPPALATSDIDITLNVGDQNSESAVCVKVHLADCCDCVLSDTGHLPDCCCFELQTMEPEPEVNGGNLNLSWKDCGDASTHCKIKGLDKSSISLGTDTTVTGSGTCDEAIAGGDFTISAKVGPITQKLQGEVCEAKEFVLPLGLGKVNWTGLSCPVAAGDIDVGVGVKLSAIIPASMATADIEVSATGSSAVDKLLCMSLHTAKAAAAADILV